MVYDYQNQEVGFYSKEDVKYINKENEPNKPKLYQKLPDLDEGISDNDNNNENLDELKEDDDDKENKGKNTLDVMEQIKKESGITPSSKSNTMKGAEIIQKLFYGFLYIMGLVLVIFVCFLYYRYKNRPQNLSSEYFIKKANELTYKI